MEQTPTLIPLEQIQPNPDQPRKVRGNPSPTLMASIRRFGVLQPIVVRPLEDGRYMIISGERRYRAALALGMKEIPAVVREMDERTAFEAAIAENAVRQNLDPLENVEILVGRLRQRGLDDELTLLWTAGQALIPLVYRRQSVPKGIVLCDFRVYDKPQGGKTKNEHFQQMLQQAKARGFAPEYALMDSWYAGLENLTLAGYF